MIPALNHTSSETVLINLGESETRNFIVARIKRLKFWIVFDDQGNPEQELRMTCVLTPVSTGVFESTIHNYTGLNLLHRDNGFPHCG